MKLLNIYFPVLLLKWFKSRFSRKSWHPMVTIMPKTEHKSSDIIVLEPAFFRFRVQCANIAQKLRVITVWKFTDLYLSCLSILRGKKSWLWFLVRRSWTRFGFDFFHISRTLFEIVCRTREISNHEPLRSKATRYRTYQVDLTNNLKLHIL